jgi:phosphatidylethanolamine/phosphatidyl-N-methylethanolamine N-methyltransferase
MAAFWRECLRHKDRRVGIGSVIFFDLCCGTDGRRRVLNQSERRRPRVFTSDDPIFLLRWLRHPTQVGAITPSGRALSQAMVRPVDWSRPGHVVELGAGMGAFTRVLLEQAPSSDRLLMVERDPVFYARLQRRFPSAPLAIGDAAALGTLLRRYKVDEVNAVVSGLPLLSMPREIQREIITQSLMAGPDPVFIQFTYGFLSPVPKRHLAKWGVKAERVDFVSQNVPPAWIWRYRMA